MQFLEIADKVKIHGRGIITEAGLEADWSAAGFELDVEGKGALTLTVQSSSSSYFRAFFDGEPELERTYVPEGISKLTYYIAEGKHNFKLLKSTSIRDSYVNFLELTYAGELLDAPAPKAKYIEFVGVSYACGSGVLGKAKDAVNKRYHDATLAYPFLVAEALDADLAITAVGGSGIVNSYNDFLIPPCYLCRGPVRDANVPYDFACARRPDLIFMDLGANDRGKGTTAEEFEETLYSFSKQILALNPGAKMVFQLYPGFKEQIVKVCDTLKEEGYPTSYMRYTWPKMLGAANHPNKEEQARMAEEIFKYLKDIL